MEHIVIQIDEPCPYGKCEVECDALCAYRSIALCVRTRRASGMTKCGKLITVEAPEEKKP